ncbi:MAG TPA: hypothetical protein PLP19_16715 [bacterium]|nr:hypothetical protein [bacterium]HPN45137.1 hypothetical protein [bacterium]
MKIIKLKIIKNIFKKLFGNVLFTIWRLEGKCKGNDFQLCMYYLGTEVEKNYLRHLWFETNLYEENLGRKYLWQIPSFISKVKSHCTLVVIECNALIKKIFKSKNDLFAPQWINGMIDIPLNIANDSAYSDYRRIRNNNLSYIITDRKEDFDNFYQTMYIPYSRLRFEDQNEEISYNTISKIIAAHNCKLLVVKQDDLPMGGIIIIMYDNQPPFIWLLGIKNANLEFLKRGTVAALYYFSATYLAQQGYKKMFVGASRPFLNDGILKYKKKWGLYIVSHSFTGFLFKPGRQFGDLPVLMKQFPFVTLEDNKMNASLFVNEVPGNKDQLIKEAQKEYWIKGLQGISIYHVSREQQKFIRLYQTQQLI